MTSKIARACALGAVALAVPTSIAAAQGGVTGGGTDKVGDSIVQYQWRLNSGYTVTTKLLARRVPSDGSVTLRCIGGKRRGCPASLPAVQVENGTAVLTAALRRRHLRAGAIVEVVISAPDQAHKCVQFRFRKRLLPATKTFELPASAEVPARCS